VNEYTISFTPADTRSDNQLVCYSISRYSVLATDGLLSALPYTLTLKE